MSMPLTGDDNACCGVLLRKYYSDRVHTSPAQKLIPLSRALLQSLGSTGLSGCRSLVHSLRQFREITALPSFHGLTPAKSASQHAASMRKSFGQISTLHPPCITRLPLSAEHNIISKLAGCWSARNDQITLGVMFEPLCLLRAAYRTWLLDFGVPCAGPMLAAAWYDKSPVVLGGITSCDQLPCCSRLCRSGRRSQRLERQRASRGTCAHRQSRATACRLNTPAVPCRPRRTKLGAGGGC